MSDFFSLASLTGPSRACAESRLVDRMETRKGVQAELQYEDSKPDQSVEGHVED